MGTVPGGFETASSQVVSPAARVPGGWLVSFASSFDDKERVRQAIDIVDLVGSYLQLRREGRGYKAICPWHDDTRPSLQVNPGAAIVQVLGLRHRRRHLQLHHEDGERRIPRSAGHAGRPREYHVDAAARARRSGDAGGAAAAAGSPDDKRTLYQAAAWAEQQFDECLLTAPEGESARRYLR